MTYADLYDEFLEELYRDQLDKIHFLCGARAGRLMREIDPTMYNCGFNDWVNSLENIKCDECGEDIADERAYDACQDDEVRCGVCAGEEFICEYCGETLAVAEQSERADDCCHACWAEQEEAEGEDD